MELNSSSLVTYAYDSKSRLVQRVEGGTTTNYTWNDWSLVREEKTGSVTETTTYLPPAGAFERGGDWFYMHGDALSSTQLVTDENGDQVARFIYGAWGEELYASESVPGVLENRFVGGLGCRKDAETGLIYMRHRWYDPALMRFISRDPLRLKGGANLYKYSRNNPVVFTDATGLRSCDPLQAIIGDPDDLKASTWTTTEDILNAEGVAQSIDIQLAEAIATNDAAMLELLIETGTMSPGQVQAARNALALINKAAHIFGASTARHNLGGLLAAYSGNGVAAVSAVEAATVETLAAAGGATSGTFVTQVTVAGFRVTVRGAFVNGVPRIGTAFIP